MSTDYFGVILMFSTFGTVIFICCTSIFIYECCKKKKEITDMEI